MTAITRDIRGVDALVDAVRRCWASLGTARATGYRHRYGVDHFGSPIAVVVQRMVNADVAGVLFTGNPLTTATDEMVVNASWGLGEAVVGGIVTPDQYTLHAGTLGIIERTVGSKALQVVRNPGNGVGTVQVAVPAGQASAPCLTDAQLVELGKLGRRVQEHYAGRPQDIEWALAGDSLYLLQSRPITGVEFSWDCEVDSANPAGEDLRPAPGLRPDARPRG